MARARYVHPSVFASPSVHKLGPAGSFFWVGVLLCADDEGRLHDAPDVLRSTIFPYPHSGVTLRRVKNWLVAMVQMGMIERYVGPDGGYYIQVAKFKSYNKPSHSTPSRIPPRNSGENSGGISGENSGEVSSRVGLGRNGLEGGRPTGAVRPSSTRLSEPPTSPAGERAPAAPVGGTVAAPASAPVFESDYEKWLATQEAKS